MSRAPVLFAVNDFPPLGGGESTLYHGLARNLPAGGTVLLAPRLPGDAAIDRRLPIEVVRRRLPPHGGVPSRMARAAAAAAHMAALMARRRFGYLVCGQLLSLGMSMRALAAAAGVPYAVFVHGADLLDYHDVPPWGRLARWVIEGADAVVVNSRFTADLVARLLPGSARRTVVLPMGVDPPRPADAAAVAALVARYRLGDGPVLLSVARLAAIKGHDVAIDALPAIAARWPRIRYLVVGAGPERARLEERARARGQSERVIFAGHVPDAELPAHFALATLFVLLSRRTGAYDGLEGYGLAFLEAASHGLPAIAGDSGGVPEAVRDRETGLLVPPCDAGAVAGAVTRLLDDAPRRARMGAAARIWAAEHPWERSARTLAALWNGDFAAERN
jgi:phosphatidylinositol alpha-1,6-mannosyltransferase